MFLCLLSTDGMADGRIANSKKIDYFDIIVTIYRVTKYPHTYSQSATETAQKRVVTIYALKTENYFKNYFLSSGRENFQKYFFQKIKKKTQNDPDFFDKLDVRKLNWPFLGDGI